MEKDWLKKIVTKVWAWFILAGAIFLMEIIFRENIQEVIKNNPSSEFYIRLIQIGIFSVPTVIGVYLAIKSYEEK